MKGIMGILAIAVIFSTLPAQTKTVTPVTGVHQDTVQQAKNIQGQQMPQCGWHELGFNNAGQNCGVMCGNTGGHGKFWKHMGFVNGFGPMGMMRMHGFAGPHIFRILFLGLIIVAIIRILLTIIVSVDMARVGKFNGLWIAIVLLTGVAGTAVYALFRIGDMIYLVKQKA